MMRFNSSTRARPRTSMSGLSTTLMMASASLPALLIACPSPSSLFPPSINILTSVTKFLPFCDVVTIGRDAPTISSRS